MARRLTYDEFLYWLERQVQQVGTRQAFAADWEISPAYLSDVLNKRRMPSRRFLDALMVHEVRLFEVDAT